MPLQSNCNQVTVLKSCPIQVITANDQIEGALPKKKTNVKSNMILLGDLWASLYLCSDLYIVLSQE